MKKSLHVLLLLSLSAFAAAARYDRRPLTWPQDGDPDTSGDPGDGGPSQSCTCESSGWPEPAPGPTSSTGPAPSATGPDAPPPPPAPPAAPSTPADPTPGPSTSDSAVPPRLEPSDTGAPGRCVLVLGFMEHAPLHWGARNASIWLDIYGADGERIPNLAWMGTKTPISQPQSIINGGLSVKAIIDQRQDTDVLSINWNHVMADNVARDGYEPVEQDGVWYYDDAYFTPDGQGGWIKHEYGDQPAPPNPTPMPPRPRPSSNIPWPPSPPRPTPTFYTGHPPIDNDNTRPGEGVPDTDDNTSYLAFEYRLPWNGVDVQPLSWSDRAGDMRCLRGDYALRENVNYPFRIDTCTFDCMLTSERRSQSGPPY